MNEIIVGVDGSATARKAAVAAAEVATNYNKPLHLVTSMNRNSSREIQGGGSESWHIDSISVAEELLKALAGELKTTTPITHAVVMNDPAGALCDEATRLDATMRRVPIRNPHLRRFWLTFREGAYPRLRRSHGV